MDGDDDIARLLPEPPPPRPARRDATIALAMRRFDGRPEPLPPAAQDHAPIRAPAGWKLRGGQIGAFASILLVALISIPIALRTPGGPLARSDQQPATERAAAPAAIQPGDPPRTAPSTTLKSRPQPPTPQASTGAATPASAAAEAAIRAATGPATTADKAMPGGDARQDRGISSRFESAPSPPPAPEPQAKMAAAAPAATISRDATVVVTGRRAAPAPAMEVSSAVTVIEEADINDDSIVVSGTRTTRSRAAASRRGDWNACTVNDPEQSLRRCKRLVDTGRKGPAGVAAAHLADGLTRAWQQDWSGAVRAFDQAIALQPRLAFAYLNRGLAFQHEGELERAAADLDRAVRYAPHAARGYYNRSGIRRQRGDERGARADSARAVDLDSRYDAVAD